MNNYEERRKWFTDRIGKKVFRDKNSCGCEACKNASDNGLVIIDESHAWYLCDIESMSGTKGCFLNYRDEK